MQNMQSKRDENLAPNTFNKNPDGSASLLRNVKLEKPNINKHSNKETTIHETTEHKRNLNSLINENKKAKMWYTISTAVVVIGTALSAYIAYLSMNFIPTIIQNATYSETLEASFSVGFFGFLVTIFFAFFPYYEGYKNDYFKT
ncbi:MAG: hypothetical protein ACP5UN_01685 [Candidatus Micrarchaeia archaeon]